MNNWLPILTYHRICDQPRSEDPLGLCTRPQDLERVLRYLTAHRYRFVSLDAAVRVRYPADGDVRKGPIKLKTIDVTSGWVAENTTWKSGLTRIVPANQFKGDLGHSSWLQNEDLAFIYRAYSTYDKPLTITSPPSGMPGGAQDCDAGSDLAIIVDASQFPN